MNNGKEIVAGIVALILVVILPWLWGFLLLKLVIKIWPVIVIGIIGFIIYVACKADDKKEIKTQEKTEDEE